MYGKSLKKVNQANSSMVVYVWFNQKYQENNSNEENTTKGSNFTTQGLKFRTYISKM